MQRFLVVRVYPLFPVSPPEITHFLKLCVPLSEAIALTRHDRQYRVVITAVEGDWCSILPRFVGLGISSHP